MARVPPPVSIVIPAFNEAVRLPATLEALQDLYLITNSEWELVVVDDGSTDRTNDVVTNGFAELDRLRIVRFDSNRGKGAAIAAGIADATNDLIVVLDADLPVPLETIIELARLLEHADIVVGSRRKGRVGGAEPQPLGRRAGGLVYLALLSALGMRVTSDPQCGVKALRRSSVGPLVAACRSPRFGFDVELLIRCRQAGLTIEDTAVPWRHVSGSSVRPWRDARVTVGELVRLRWRMRVR